MRPPASNSTSKSSETCRLCGAIGTLRDSHIIPEFFQRLIADQVEQADGRKQPRYSSLSTKPAAGYDQKQIPPSERGIFQERLLCAKCEEKFGRLEKVARETLFSNTPADRVRKDRSWIIDPVGAHSSTPFKVQTRSLIATKHYRELKQFELSMVWRAAIASHSFYEHCSLSEDLREDLRRILDQEETPPAGYIPCYLLDLDLPGLNLLKSLDTPRRSKKPHRDILLMIICGYGWAFQLNPRTVSASGQDDFLRDNGTLPLLRVDAEPWLDFWRRNSR